MKLLFQCIIILLFATSTIGCKSYSKYPIDEKPITKTDSSLYGIWKAVEDTDKANYILVQSPFDVFHHIDWWYHLDSVQKRTYFTEDFLKDPERVKEAFHKDPTMFSESYNDFIDKKDHYYCITRMEWHGKSSRYEQWCFLSKVNNATFLNVPYRYIPKDANGHFVSKLTEEGYFFVRLIKINAANDTITTAIIADPMLKNITSAKDVRKHIEKNINNPAFYSDTLHFYRVSSYHLTMEESKIKAN